MSEKVTSLFYALAFSLTREKLVNMKIFDEKVKND